MTALVADKLDPAPACRIVTPKLADATLRLSPSIAKILLARSPYHAWHAHSKGGAHQDDPTDAKRRGKLLDRLLFGQGPDIVIVEADDWRTKAAQAAKREAEAARKIPVLAYKLKPAQEMVERWKDQFFDRGIDLRGESQVSLLWESLGCPCKGILDHQILNDDSATIIDLKTCEDASLDSCRRSIVNYGYDIQHAAYVEAVTANYPKLAGRIDMLFVFCEAEPPYGVNVVKFAGTMKALGQLKWDQAKSTWADCLRRNHFPSYDALSSLVEASPWQIRDAFPEGVPDEFAASV